MPTLFDLFASDCATILSQIGRDVVFRGATVKAICAEPQPSDILGIGGFGQGSSQQVFKFLRASYAENPIKSGELIEFNGSKWVVATVDSRPLGPWFLASCKPWEA